MTRCRPMLAAVFVTVVVMTGAGFANVFTMDRPGAGAPSGWKTAIGNAAWETEPGEGPVGPGAARIRFGEGGRVTSVSPPFTLRPGITHAVALWVKSEPPGATVSWRVCDNDSDRMSAHNQTVQATGDWQLATTATAMFGAVKGRYYLELSLSGSNTTLWIDGLWMGEVVAAPGPDWRPEVHPAGVSLAPEAPWGVAAGAEPMRVRARVAGGLAPGWRVNLRAVNTSGQESMLPSLLLNGAVAHEETFEVGGDIAKTYGTIRIEATVVDDAGKPVSAMNETILSHVPEPVPGPRPESPFGIHVRMREPDTEAVAKLGYKWCRVHDAATFTKWGVAEPNPGEWTWYDGEFEAARKHGLSVMGLLDGSPAWESGNPTTEGYWSIYYAPKSIDLWRHYVRTVVSHYTGIDHWEVWNEPWDMARFFAGGTPKLYAELLQAAYEEAKAVKPDCTIIGIDTYPPFWETAVLAYGAYPYYDVLSWHRYDPTLHGRPGDAIERVTRRVNAAQAKYGPPKPTLASEGGPDVGIFHGSFFSFADPYVIGDWSLGADRYVRWFLSVLAAGNERFIAYSAHGETRHGQPTHMLVEPGYLLPPMHAALAGCAHFIEGARFIERLAPAHDISALWFEQPDGRDFAPGPCIVAVLFANGPDSEPLPLPLPEGAACFDRWANPIAAPAEAGQSPVYVVIAPDSAAALREALTGPEAPPVERRPVDELLGQTVASLSGGEPPLWTLFSSQGSVAVTTADGAPRVTTRARLRADASEAAPFALPEGVALVTAPAVRHGGPFSVGQAALAAGDRQWKLAFTLVPDGIGGTWRYVSMTLLPDTGETDPATALTLQEKARTWESALATGDTARLYPHLAAPPCLAAAATLNGEYFVLDRMECLVSMMDTAVMIGPAKLSKLAFDDISAAGGVATLYGKWDIMSLAFGAGSYAMGGTLVNTDGDWKFVSICASAGMP